MEMGKEKYFKAVLGIVLCLLVRLIPFRAPNVEPIMATLMPISRIYGKFITFFFATSSILIFDLITHTFGVQTIFTTLAYGVVALWSVNYFSAKGGSASGGKNNVRDYVRFAIIGTLFFDAFTGLTVGPIFFHQSFMQSLIGQIPFTALHLLGNITFAVLLSPTIYKILSKKKETISYVSILNPKII